MQSFGSQAWDCSLAIQAQLAGNINDEIAPVLKKAHEFLKMSQVRQDPPDHLDHFRHFSKGALTFSDRDHGWQVSDCTAEGLKVISLTCLLTLYLYYEFVKLYTRRTLKLYLARMFANDVNNFLFFIFWLIFQCCVLLAKMSPGMVGEPMVAEHMYDSVNVILSLQVRKEECDETYLHLIHIRAFVHNIRALLYIFLFNIDC